MSSNKRKSVGQSAAGGGDDDNSKKPRALEPGGAAAETDAATAPEPMDLSPATYLRQLEVKSNGEIAGFWCDRMKMHTMLASLASELFPDYLYDKQTLAQLSNPESLMAKMLRNKHIDVNEFHVSMFINHLQNEVQNGFTDTRSLLQQWVVNDKLAVPQLVASAPGHRRQEVRESCASVGCPNREILSHTFFALDPSFYPEYYTCYPSTLIPRYGKGVRGHRFLGPQSISEEGSSDRQVHGGKNQSDEERARDAGARERYESSLSVDLETKKRVADYQHNSKELYNIKKEGGKFLRKRWDLTLL